MISERTKAAWERRKARTAAGHPACPEAAKRGTAARKADASRFEAIGPDTGYGSISFEGEWGHGMKAQGTKLQATENDLKRLMADVSRAMEKAQEAITRIASNPAVTATETKRAQC
jgi:hypothetical protein